jgi:hypothetical protein
MAFFKTQNLNLSKFWRALQWKMLVYFIAIWSKYFAAIWYRYIAVIWYISWLFHIFFPFWYVVPRKIWQPWSEQLQSAGYRLRLPPWRLVLWVITSNPVRVKRVYNRSDEISLSHWKIAHQCNYAMRPVEFWNKKSFPRHYNSSMNKHASLLTSWRFRGLNPRRVELEWPIGPWVAFSPMKWVRPRSSY